MRTLGAFLLTFVLAALPGRSFIGGLAFGVMLAATFAHSQTKPPTEGPAVGETPAWFLQGSFPDPTGRTIVEPGGKVTVPPRAGGAGGRGANFDSKGNPWMASGQDGQFLKMTRDGKIVGAIGNGMGIGHGQFIEASYWVMDKQDNLYAGDTSVGRVTKMVAPKK